MKGRKQTPTALKIIRGNPGKRALPKDEPKPEVVCPNPPTMLDAVAKRHWRKISKQLAKIGVLTEIDTDALTLYCSAYSRWLEAHKHIVNNGMTYITASGTEATSPYIHILNKTAEQMHKLMADFGMTPSTRTKIVAPSKDKSDGWNDV